MYDACRCCVQSVVVLTYHILAALARLLVSNRSNAIHQHSPCHNVISCCSSPGVMSGRSSDTTASFMHRSSRAMCLQQIGTLRNLGVGPVAAWR